MLSEVPHSSEAEVREETQRIFRNSMMSANRGQSGEGAAATPQLLVPPAVSVPEGTGSDLDHHQTGAVEEEDDAALARRLQEEDDAALARRLQEEG